MTEPSRVPRHTIGVVLRLLTDDFPDVTISKIRFLESEGLVTPDRTPSGYRTFSDADVERLRFILAAQRDHFWPLRVIRDALAGRDRGDVTSQTPASSPSGSSVEAPGASSTAAGSRNGRRRSSTDLAAEAGLARRSLQELVSYGLLRPDADGLFDETDVEVALAAQALLRHGVEVRHLRPFKSAADREVDLVHHVVSPLVAGRGGDRGSRDAPEGDQAADEARGLAEDLLHRCIELHRALLERRWAEEPLRPRRGRPGRRAGGG